MSNNILLGLVICFSIACSQNRDNEYTERYSNGEVSLKGITQNDVKIGIWTKFDSLGNKIMELEYDSGLLVKRRIYANGYLFSQEEMKGEEIKDGLSVFYYPDGTVEGENSFVNGEQIGQQKFYYQNGNISSSYMETDSGIVDFEQFYENGILMVEARSLVNGEVLVYDSTGNKLYDLLYQNSELADTLRKY